MYTPLIQIPILLLLLISVFPPCQPLKIISSNYPANSRPLTISSSNTQILIQISNMTTVSHQGLTFKLLYSQEHIEQVISNLAKQINEYYSSILAKEGELELVVVCVLKGAFMFFSDLVKKIEHNHTHEFIRCKSYEGTESTGKLKVETELKPEKFANKHVLIVEDIHDTGHTLQQLIELLEEFKPKKVDSVVLVKRPDKQVHIDLKFCGLVCSDFIIGYGLDFEEWGRHLPEIYQKI